MIQLILGTLVIVGTVYLLIKKHETRLVLFGAGLLLAIISLNPMSAFDAFSAALKKTSLLEPIIAVMGYATVMSYTKCDKHLIYLLTRYLKKAGYFLVPGVVLATFFINISLTSTAGISAAVGAIFIPLLVSAGIHPAIAAAAVLSGTFGSSLNPGYPMTALTAEIAARTPVEVVANHSTAVIITILVVGIVLSLIAYIRKEHKGFESSELGEGADVYDHDFKIEYSKAILPILPLILIMVVSAKLVPGISKIAISHSMLIGVIVTMAVTRACPSELTKQFFKGAGNAFGSIFSIIIAAAIFTTGLESVGMIDALTKAMISNPGIAKISSAAGPFIMAVMTGSGEAATVAFNQAITINATQFGLDPMNMGSVAALAGSLGRAVSPLSGGVIILAGFAKVSTFDIVKRTAPGMIIALILITTILFSL